MTTYYFAEAGDDAADGLSETTPKRTLQEATSLSASLLPGEKLRLKRSDRFFGSLLPQAPGTIDDPIMLGAYGDGPNPVIDGSQQIDTKWKFYSESYPHVYGTFWAPQDSEHSLRKLFLDGVAANHREEILNDVNSPGDWFFDPVKSRILLYSKDGKPDKVFSEIRGTSLTNCIRIEGPTNIIVDGIDCTRANNKNVKVTGDSFNVALRDLVLSEAGSSGYLQTGSASNGVLLRVRSIRNGISVFDHGFYFGTSEDNGRFYSEDCEAAQNYGYGFHCYQSSVGGEIVRPKGGGNGKKDIVVNQVNGSVRITL